MKRPVVRIALAALASYIWGMAFWGFSGLPYQAWNHAVEDEAASAAIRKYFPETGTYYVPGMYVEEGLRTRLHEQGPVGFVHVTAHDGRPVQVPLQMAAGFVLLLVLAALLEWLMTQAAPGLPSYGRRVGFVAMMGLAASVAIHIGDTVWWFIPLEWKLYQAFYEIAAWVVMGLVLASRPG